MLNHGKNTNQAALVARLLGIVCMISAVLSVDVQAGTEGFGLGIDELPLGPDTTFQTGIERIDRPLQEPSQPTFGALPTFEQPPPFPIRLKDNLVALVVAPLDWDGSDWTKVGLGVLAVGAVSLLDEEVNNWADRTRSESSVTAIKAYRPLGEYGGLALLGLTWVAGRAADRPKLTAVAEDSIEATILAAGVVTPLLKTVFGRERPRTTDQGYTFGGAGRSFPSGESTQAFAIASVIAAHSESSWAKAVAWGSASLVGLGRIGLDGHWASDVVAGALIGAAVGTWVVRRNRPDLESRIQMTWIPTVGKDHYGLSMHVSF